MGWAMKFFISKRVWPALFLLAGAPVQAGVVVVMSAKSDTNALSKAQVAQIYMAKSDALPDGKLARPIDQPEGTAVRNEFYQKVVGKDAAQMKAYWSQLVFTGKAQPPRVESGDAAVKQAVAANASALGYINENAVDGSVKVVFRP